LTHSHLSRLTEQEAFWTGEFGDEYIARNTGSALLASSLARFATMLRAVSRVSSVLECGANVGLNLRAFHSLLPEAELAAVEINKNAATILRALGYVDVTEGSIVSYEARRTYELVFTSGVLIHIAPESLPAVYDAMYRASSKYIALAEYYAPTPTEIPYRGHRERMFKRDFAGDLIDRFPDLELVDYGFFYHRDNNFGHDDLTWFVLRKGSVR
jgi:pseudaminic acid biosynthesis-associated methylase